MSTSKLTGMQQHFGALIIVDLVLFLVGGLFAIYFNYVNPTNYSVWGWTYGCLAGTGIFMLMVNMSANIWKWPFQPSFTWAGLSIFMGGIGFQHLAKLSIWSSSIDSGEHVWEPWMLDIGTYMIYISVAILFIGFVGNFKKAPPKNDVSVITDVTPKNEPRRLTR